MKWDDLILLLLQEDYDKCVDKIRMVLQNQTKTLLLAPEMKSQSDGSRRERIAFLDRALDMKQDVGNSLLSGCVYF